MKSDFNLFFVFIFAIFSYSSTGVAESLRMPLSCDSLLHAAMQTSDGADLTRLLDDKELLDILGIKANTPIRKIHDAVVSIFRNNRLREASVQSATQNLATVSKRKKAELEEKIETSPNSPETIRSLTSDVAIVGAGLHGLHSLLGILSTDEGKKLKINVFERQSLPASVFQTAQRAFNLNSSTKVDSPEYNILPREGNLNRVWGSFFQISEFSFETLSSPKDYADLILILYDFIVTNYPNVNFFFDSEVDQRTEISLEDKTSKGILGDLGIEIREGDSTRQFYTSTIIETSGLGRSRKAFNGAVATELYDEGERQYEKGVFPRLSTLDTWLKIAANWEKPYRQIAGKKGLIVGAGKYDKRTKKIKGGDGGRSVVRWLLRLVPNSCGDDPIQAGCASQIDWANQKASTAKAFLKQNRLAYGDIARGYTSERINPIPSDVVRITEQADGKLVVRFADDRVETYDFVIDATGYVEELYLGYRELVGIYDANGERLGENNPLSSNPTLFKNIRGRLPEESGRSDKDVGILKQLQIPVFTKDGRRAIGVRPVNIFFSGVVAKDLVTKEEIKAANDFQENEVANFSLGPRAYMGGRYIARTVQPIPGLHQEDPELYLGRWSKKDYSETKKKKAKKIKNKDLIFTGTDTYRRTDLNSEAYILSRLGIFLETEVERLEANSVFQIQFRLPRFEPSQVFGDLEISQSESGLVSISWREAKLGEHFRDDFLAFIEEDPTFKRELFRMINPRQSSVSRSLTLEFETGDEGELIPQSISFDWLRDRDTSIETTDEYRPNTVVKAIETRNTYLASRTSPPGVNFESQSIDDLGDQVRSFFKASGLDFDTHLPEISRYSPSWRVSAALGRAPNLRATERVIQATKNAFALIRDDGSVVTWGDKGNGGDSSEVKRKLKNVVSISATEFAFAALKADGTVVTWGAPLLGGNSDQVRSELVDIKTIYSTKEAFAALKKDGTVVTWGNPRFGGDNGRVQSRLVGVKTIYSSNNAFSALRNDGQIVAWGARRYYVNKIGELPNTNELLQDLDKRFVTVVSNELAFAGLTETGEIISWGGDRRSGGGEEGTLMEWYSPSSANPPRLKSIYSTRRAFAILLENGQCFSWGDPNGGGRVSTENVSKIVSTSEVFATLKNDGSVSFSTENYRLAGEYDPEEDPVAALYANNSSFLGITKSGRVVFWSKIPSYVDRISKLLRNIRNVIAVYSTSRSFSLLRADGTVVLVSPEEEMKLPKELEKADTNLSPIRAIYSNANAFVAIRNDGTFVAWGDEESGGDLSKIDPEILRIGNLNRASIY